MDYCVGERCLYDGSCDNDFDNGAFQCMCTEEFNGTYCQRGTQRHCDKAISSYRWAVST